MLVAGLAGGLAVNVSTTLLQEHNGALGPARLSQGNAAAAGIGLITPLVVGAATAAGLTWRAAMVLVIPFAVTAWILITRHRTVPAYAAEPHGSPCAVCRRRIGWPLPPSSARWPSSSA